MKIRREFDVMLAKAGLKQRHVAEYFGVPLSTVQHILAFRTQTTSIRGGNYLYLKDIVAWLKLKEIK